MGSDRKSNRISCLDQRGFPTGRMGYKFPPPPPPPSAFPILGDHPFTHPASPHIPDHSRYQNLIIDGFQLTYGNIDRRVNIRRDVLGDCGRIGKGNLTACIKVGISKDSACWSCNFKIQKYTLHEVSTDRLYLYPLQQLSFNAELELQIYLVCRPHRNGRYKD